MAKRVKGTGGGFGNSLPGAQTIGRTMAQQFNLRGGLANATDISAQNPNEWLFSQNAKILTTNVPSDQSLNAASNFSVGGITNQNNNQQTFFNGSNNTYFSNSLVYSCPPSEFCVASLEIGVSFPSETVSYSGTGTGSTVNSFSVGDKCIQLALTASQTITAAVTVPDRNLSSSIVPASNNVLAIDFNWTNPSNFSSGFIRVGSSPSNYYQWTLSSPGSVTNQIFKLNWASPSSTTGSPDLANVTYVAIGITSSSGGSLTVKCSNLRVSAFSSTSLANNGYKQYAANVSRCFPYVSDSAAGLRQLVVQCRNVLYIQNSLNSIGGTLDSDQLLFPLKTGFNANNASNQYYQKSFIFSTFPIPGTQNQNVLYYVNGVDGLFSYNANASAGSRHSLISNTAFTTLASHKNYMWYAGDPNNPNTLTPSIISTPASLDTANAITLDNSSGQSYITGLVSMDNYLIIFRNNDIWILLGSTTGAGGDIVVQKSKSTVGALLQIGVCRAGQYAYFFNGNDLFIFDGDQSVIISEKINLTDINGGNSVVTCGVSLAYNPQEQSVYIFMIPSDPNAWIGFFGFTNPISSSLYSSCATLIYNTVLKTFALSGANNDVTSVCIGGFSFTSFINGNSYFYTYGLNISSTNIQFNSVVTLTSWDQQFAVQSCWNNLGSPFVLKDPDQIRLFITGYADGGITGTLNFYTDFNTNRANPNYTTKFDLPIAGASSGFVDLTIGPGCQGHAFSIEVIVPNNNNGGSGPTGTIVYSGYGITWTIAEVI